MVQINFARQEVNCKIIYYGPGMSGKTTNLEIVHKKAPDSHKGKLTSIATEGDRTLFFDYMPLSLGKVAGMTTNFQLYTVPGQVYYNATRKQVLQGADGVIFVADSQEGKLSENIESLENLKENLAEYGEDITSLPLVLQYNKRDLERIMEVSLLEEKLNIYGVPYFEACAVTGVGVFPTLKKLTALVLDSINDQLKAPTLPTAASKKKAKAAPKEQLPAPAAEPKAGDSSKETPGASPSPKAEPKVTPAKEAPPKESPKVFEKPAATQPKSKKKTDSPKQGSITSHGGLKGVQVVGTRDTKEEFLKIVVVVILTILLIGIGFLIYYIGM